MRPISARILEIVPETPTVRTLRFDHSLDPVPGQYLMVWVRGVDEVPMSISYRDGITVQLVGEATREIFDLEVGESLGLRGPLGNGFTLSGEKILLIGGGVGAAPLALLGEAAAEEGVEVSTLLGFRCCDEILFRERFERIGELVMTTDDGSQGICGLASAGPPGLHLPEFDHIDLSGRGPLVGRTDRRRGAASLSARRTISAPVALVKTTQSAASILLGRSAGRGSSEKDIEGARIGLKPRDRAILSDSSPRLSGLRMAIVGCLSLSDRATTSPTTRIAGAWTSCSFALSTISPRVSTTTLSSGLHPLSMRAAGVFGSRHPRRRAETFSVSLETPIKPTIVPPTRPRA